MFTYFINTVYLLITFNQYLINFPPPHHLGKKIRSKSNGRCRILYKSGHEMKLLPENMTITPWRALQGVKDEKLVKTILSHVK